MVEIKIEKGTYTISGLTLEDLENIQEGLHRLFNESNKDRHRGFRTQVLYIDRVIDPELAKLLK